MATTQARAASQGSATHHHGATQVLQQRSPGRASKVNPSATSGAAALKGGAPSMLKTRPNKKPRRVTVYINGDANFAGKSLMLDPKRTPKMEMFLDLLTKQLDPPFGPVLRVINLTQRKEVKALADVAESDALVACGRGPFKRLNYQGILDFREREKTYVAPNLNKLKKPAPAVESRIKDSIIPTRQFYFLPNGDETGLPTKLVCRAPDVEDWTRFLEMVTEKLAEQLLADTKKIYTLAGQEVHGSSELVDNKMYVAVDRGGFKQPPFVDEGNGQIRRLPAKKVASVPLPKIEPRKQRELKHTVAFGRTGDMNDIPKRNLKPDSKFVKKPQRRRSRPLGSIPANSQAQASQNESSADSTSAAAQHSSLASSSQRLTFNSAQDVLVAYQHVVDAARKAFPDHEQFDDILVAIQDKNRQQLYDHRQQAPDVTTAFDDRVDDVLAFMMRSGDVDPEERDESAQSLQAVSDAAVSGRLSHWEATPNSFIALVVLLDQLPRALYKDTKRMFSGDGLSYKVVHRAIFDSGVMDEVHPVYRLFPCLALTHQEDATAQQLCVAEWQRACEYLEPDDPIRGYQQLFERNRDVINYFGRFPERNQLLGRASTAEEQTFLKENVAIMN